MTDDTPTADDDRIAAEDHPPDTTDDDSRDAGANHAPLDPREQRTVVRERYGSIAAGPEPSCCGTNSSIDSCCDSDADRIRDRGYSGDDLAVLEEGAVPGLGCGNPTAIASLDPGEDVLDLGSGGGFDCQLAAREVGPDGRVVGVDMTPEMVEKARESVATSDAANDATNDDAASDATGDDATSDDVTSDRANVEFRLGEIEHLPVADESVDVVLSNCVVNLSPDKPRVFREAYRVLRPGGRLAVSDVVLTAEPPAGLRADPESVAACVAGAAPIAALESMLADAGFEAASVEPDADSESFVREWDDERDPSDFVLAATIEAEKPAT